jgi:phospholipid transport system substrate-binding protein
VTKYRLNLLTSWLVATISLVLLSLIPTQAQNVSPPAKLVQDYCQKLLPTIQQASRLSVLERNQRFTPVMSSVFDFATMTKLAVGPSWSTFTGAQQAAIREAFTRFTIAEYANQVADYSGVGFVVDPQTRPAPGGGA